MVGAQQAEGVLGFRIRNWTLRALLCGAVGVLTLGADPARADKGSKFCTPTQINSYVRTSQDEDGAFKVVTARFYEEAMKLTSQHRSLRIFDKGGKHYAGTDAIIKFWNETYSLKDTRWLAYVLATALHESRLHPVREHFGKTDQESIDKLRRWASGLSNSNIRRNVYRYTTPDPVTGHAYFGRGFVQLTWADNYKRADGFLDIPKDDKDRSFYWNPNFQLEPNNSVRTLYSGMVYGWYRRSHCLLRYVFPKQPADYRRARNIVNGGLDKTARITGYANAFEAVLKRPGVVVPNAEFERAVAEVKAEGEKKVEEKKTEDVAALLAAVRRDAETRIAAQAQTVSALQRDLAGQREVFAQQIVELRALIEAQKLENAALRDRVDDQETAIASQESELARIGEQLTLAKGERDRLGIALQDATSEAEKQRTALMNQVNTLLARIGSAERMLTEHRALLDKLAIDVRRANDRTLWDYLFGRSSDEDEG